jgi:3-keto-5-aminohexanoate cleavage enzyme
MKTIKALTEGAFVINSALTGAVADFRKNPNVPITPATIVEQALQCHAAGSSIVHIHVRDDEGRPSPDPKRFAAVFAQLRASEEIGDLILCATTSGRHGQTLEQRAAVLDLPADIRPDMASLTLGSLNFLTGASVNDHDTVRRLCEKMQIAGVKPELEVFDLGMVMFLHQLIHEGLLAAPFYVNVLLGNVSSAQVDPSHFGLIRAQLPEDSIVCIAGLGRYQMRANLLGIAVADGARVGLEDNLWFDERRTPATNLGLVARLAEIARLAQREPASPTEVRARLGLQAAIGHQSTVSA